MMVYSRLATAMSLAALLSPALAQAQVNIDQGKPPAQIFANDCAACHKATRGLAVGKNTLTLTAFLREHYTTSREQAAALAAYVLGAGGASPAPKPGQAAKNEDAKAADAKPGARGAKPGAKPDEAAPATAKLQVPSGEDAKPDEQPGSGSGQGASGPAQQPAVSSREARPAPAARGHKPEASPTTQEPAAAVAAGPTSTEPSNPGASQASSQDQNAVGASAQPEAQTGEDAPVPRDNIPD